MKQSVTLQTGFQLFCCSSQDRIDKVELDKSLFDKLGE